MSIIKRITDKTIAIAVIIATTLALMFGALSFTFTARAADDEDEIEEFPPTSLGLSNAQFSESSGSYPATPSSWTKGTAGDFCGVIDLTPSVYNTDTEGGNKKFKLDQYDEYKTSDRIPKTIFGSDSDYSGTDKKTLLINTAPGVEAAYSYTSSEMSFAPNSFYRIGVWVKTGNFDDGTGATIKLNGLGENCSFININTVKNIALNNGMPDLNESNNYGWVEHRFYVRTSAALTKSVTLTLGIGDEIADNDEDSTNIMPTSAHGYAFFDTVSAERISAYDYAHETTYYTKTERDNVLTNGVGTGIAIDLYEADFMSVNNGAETTEIGTFSDATLDRDDAWDINASYDDSEDISYAGASSVIIYNSEAHIDDFTNNEIGLTQNPWAPLGKAEFVGNENFAGGSNGNILMIYTTNGKAARGVASPTVTIERYGFYRFSVWVKGDNVKDGSGISLAVKGQKNDTAAENKLSQWYNNLAGDSSDNAHYGWKEQVVYIKGSMLTDLDIHFEMWLGTPDGVDGSNKSTGVAMFDNVTFTKLDYSDYAAMSEADGGNVIELDAAATATGVNNGNFMSVGDYDEFKYPLPAAEWNYYTASDVTAQGFSKAEVNTDNVVHGIIPTDPATFDEIKSEGTLPSVRNPKEFAGAPDYSALIISSVTKTAVCYQSPAITAAVDKAYKLTVDMAVDSVSADGYGASLVLKTAAGAVVSTIEGIKDTNGAFNTYTFYIDAPLSETTLNVEIWLGLNDRKDNTTKLSDGNIYVKSVAIAEWTAAENSTIDKEFGEIRDAYLETITDANRIKSLDYGVISFKAPTLAYYDAYSYMQSDGFGVPYVWSMSSANSNVIGGIFDTNNLKADQPYRGFEAKDRSGSMLYIYNTEPNRTTYTYDNTLSIVSNTYYRLDVTLKVNVTDEVRKDDNSIGAGINLTGAVTESFENIKDTTTLISQGHEETRDYETFKTYTFYISSGANGGDLGLNFTFGGSDSASQIQGRLVIADVSLKSINNTEYDNAKKNLNSTYERAVELSEAAADDSDDNTEAPASSIAWWVLPTVIFGACLIAAIIIILIVRLRDRAKKNKKQTYTSEYDRAVALKHIDKLAAEKNSESNKPSENNSDETLDDGSANEVEGSNEVSTDETADGAEDQPEAEAEKEEVSETTETSANEAETPEPEVKKAPEHEDLDD